MVEGSMEYWWDNNWQENTEELGEEPAPMPLFLL
jgi:hypothetical protein